MHFCLVLLYNNKIIIKQRNCTIQIQNGSRPHFQPPNPGTECSLIPGFQYINCSFPKYYSHQHAWQIHVGGLYSPHVSFSLFFIFSLAIHACMYTYIVLHTYTDHGTTLCQPFTTTKFAKRAFRCSAPAVWNSLPKTVLSSDSVAVFKLRLKTFLFSQAFSSFSALCNMLHGPSTSEVTTLWRYTNLYKV